MADLGFIALRLALALAAYAAVGSLVGVWQRLPEVVRSARYATYLTALALAVATAALVGAFITHDFQVRYVAEHSNRAMEPIYTWVAFYSGNEGSLLFLALVLAGLSSLALARAPRHLQSSLPHVNLIMMLVLTFFLAVTAFLADPFARLPFTPADGRGINPLLTHPGMFVHPPVQMGGLIAVTIPFAFAIGTLLSGKVQDEWVGVGRTWGLVAWALLGGGLLLGAWWAYTILGWGGYWAWDPVENAALMPWLGLTAFIHSIMVQRRRGMFRLWNIALINVAFTLALFGMFINRGGPVASVHSFGQSTLGWIFLMFLGVTLVFSFAVFFRYMPRLRSNRNLESTLSREAAFLVNNLVLLAVAFVTLWGVMYPLISDVFLGSPVSVAEPFYNQVNGPLLMGLIFLMGVGPLLPWRRASWTALQRALRVPVLVAVVVVAVVLVVGIRNPLVVLSFGLCSMVVGGILHEWVRGTRSRHRRGESYPVAFGRLMVANRPRYGGYIVHLAVVALVLGIAGSSFYDLQRDVILAPGGEASIGAYRVQYLGTQVIPKADRREYASEVRLYRGEVALGTVTSRRIYYPSFDMASARPFIRSNPVEDVYVTSTELLEDGSAVFRLWVRPLVWWMWAAGPVFVLGTLVSLWPDRRTAVRYIREREPQPVSADVGSV